MIMVWVTQPKAHTRKDEDGVIANIFFPFPFWYKGDKKAFSLSLSAVKFKFEHSKIQLQIRWLAATFLRFHEIFHREPIS